MAEIAGVTAERDALREVVARERASFDEYVLRVGVLESRIQVERDATNALVIQYERDIATLQKTLHRARGSAVWWGLLGAGIGYGVAR